MRKMTDRLNRLEHAMQVSNAPITDVRRASDAQLEAFLASFGIDPGDEAELIAVTQGWEPVK